MRLSRFRKSINTPEKWLAHRRGRRNDDGMDWNAIDRFNAADSGQSGKGPITNPVTCCAENIL